MNIKNRTVVLKLSKDNGFDDIKISTKMLNFILNIGEMNQSLFEQISNKLLIFGADIKRRGGSLVIVSKVVFSDNFNVVATIQEAYDFIELEEIERQLKI